MCFRARRIFSIPNRYISSYNIMYFWDDGNNYFIYKWEHNVSSNVEKLDLEWLRITSGGKKNSFYFSNNIYTLPMLNQHERRHCKDVTIPVGKNRRSGKTIVSGTNWIYLKQKFLCSRRDCMLKFLFTWRKVSINSNDRTMNVIQYKRT